MCFIDSTSHTASRQNKRRKVYISDKVHPQTLAVVRTRAVPLGLEVLVGDITQIDFSNRDACAALFQYPDTEGTVLDFSTVVKNAQTNGVSAAMTLVCFFYMVYFLSIKLSSLQTVWP